MQRIQDLRLVLAATGCAAALLVLGVALGRALATTPRPAPLADPAAAVLPLVSEASATTTVGFEGGVASAPVEVLRMAVDQDPFMPTRDRAPEYRIGGRVETVEAVERPEPEPPPAFNIVGVVTSPSGGFAMVQVDAGEPQLVAVGESIQGYRLVSVDAERATFQGASRRLAFAVSDPQAPQRNDRRVNNRNNERNERAPASVPTPTAMPLPALPPGAVVRYEASFGVDPATGAPVAAPPVITQGNAQPGNAVAPQPIQMLRQRLIEAISPENLEQLRQQFGGGRGGQFWRGGN